ncbi:PEP/pyruvate-binding domain-containing protein [Paraferrimonas haliotis]|uniref:Pyruvate phosphate dikinase AMP/ATP-binding domain-containing protein n=1 Tax=Paraferrimonas haliotis TaxID=2013866 RepID=A0AA37TNZ3_9GAMM|nr:PEP/pyruvate-binding domain-containing protein [Paraferrimonas haliotis]GLS84028.1 hypothetical protein GCM10007894_20050 [Paraferrimonas haliotis]
MSVELYFLGAGKPASGDKPAALKNIALNLTAMDWQLHSFQNIARPSQTHFIGGYHIEDVVRQYPELNFTVASDWQHRTALDSLLTAPFNGRPVITSYSDTLFRRDFVNRLIETSADVTMVIDSAWQQRYQGRSQTDMVAAETLLVNGEEVEFTGLMHLSSKAVDVLQGELNNARLNSDQALTQLQGKSLLALIAFFEQTTCSINYVDVRGDWAEFNSPTDIANFILGTKADTLARLEHRVKKSVIGKQESFTTLQWRSQPQQVINAIRGQFGDSQLVVRSSSKGEDNWHSSNAGGFESILNVSGVDDGELTEAVNAVVDSYGKPQTDSDQVLVQAFLTDVAMAGVVFTCTLESGAPYYRFNFDDSTQSTESVTAGTHGELRTVLVSKLCPEALSKSAAELNPVLTAVQELEQILGFDKLDIEFAVDNQGHVHIFQVRPVVVNHDNYDIDIDRIKASIDTDLERFKQLQERLPFICGDNTLFANMPDWNPAEIIGTRPKPLAFSLYQQLITNDVWAQQRAEYGYKDVRPYPLIVAFSGQPYVDVRASFNSFLPKDLSVESGERIVNAYLTILRDNPHYHDKIEFDVAFTIWTPDFQAKAQQRLMPYGVTQQDIDLLELGLKAITRRALTRLQDDIASIATLSLRSKQIVASSITPIDKVLALLDDCKRFGTLAFSHAARAGFVATTMLNYLVGSGALAESRKLQFLNSFTTVAGDFEQDKASYVNGSVSEQALIEKYGHLRPGTYEVTTQAYWEDPQQYILPSEAAAASHDTSDFEFTEQEISAIEQLLNGLESELSWHQFS